MDFLSQEILAILGLIAVFLVAAFTVLLFFGILFVYFMSKNQRVVRFLSSTIGAMLSKTLISLLDLFYVPSKKVISLLGGNSKLVDLVNIEMKNMLFRKSFSRVPFKERIVLLPQCLRSLDCPTKFHSVEGARCVKCGKCKIYKITEKAEELGYKGTYIAPGGGFVRRILKKVKPKAVVGIGCPYEVYAGMGLFKKDLPGQGVILLSDGCVETDVALDEIYHVLEMREDEN